MGIIEDLIKIDKEAQKITLEVEEKEKNLSKDVEEASKKVINKIKEDTNKKIEQLRMETQASIEIKMNEVKMESKHSLDGLLELYEKNHLVWEDEIFNKILDRNGRPSSGLLTNVIGGEG